MCEILKKIQLRDRAKAMTPRLCIECRAKLYNGLIFALYTRSREFSLMSNTRNSNFLIRGPKTAIFDNF